MIIRCCEYADTFLQICGMIIEAIPAEFSNVLFQKALLAVYQPSRHGLLSYLQPCLIGRNLIEAQFIMTQIHGDV